MQTRPKPNCACAGLHRHHARRPRWPRKTNKYPEKGSSFRTLSAWATSVSNPRPKSAAT